jgi:hypothetical protein
VRDHGLQNGLILSPKGWYGIVRLGYVVAILPDLTYVEEFEQAETHDLRTKSYLAHHYTDDQLQRGRFVYVISTGYFYRSTGDIAHVRKRYIVAVTPQKAFHRFLEFERLLNAFAEKPEIGRFIVDAKDGMLDMPGNNECIAIISGERVTRFFRNRAEYDDFVQGRESGTTLEQSIVKQEEANRELSDRLATAEKERLDILAASIINDEVELKLGDRVEHIISGQIETNAGWYYHISDHVVTGITRLDDTQSRVAQEIGEYDDEWEDWKATMAGGYDRSPPPPPRTITRAYGHRSAPTTWVPS